MTYATTFSGVGGWDLGLDAAGLTCLWHCEIDQKCNDVRRLHWDVPTVTDIRAGDAFDALPVPDVFVMSPPCQDLSVAGKRAGLAGARSGLFYDAADVAGRFVRRGTRFVVMEQVPGLLSSHAGADFRAVLQRFLELGARDVAWAVLDSQWFGVAQRRRRLYFVVDFGGERAGEILALEYGLQGHPAPRREAGKVAPALSSSGAGTGRTGNERTEADFLVAKSLRAQAQASHREDSDNYIVARYTGQGYWNDDGLGSLRAHPGGIPENLVASVAGTLLSGGSGERGRLDPADNVDALVVTHTLSADGFDASEDGTGRGTPLVAFQCKDSGENSGDLAPTLRSMNHDESHANGGGQIAVAFGWNKSPSQTMRTSEETTDSPGASPSSNPGVAVAWSGDPTPKASTEVTGCMRADHGGEGFGVAQGMAVRRLTPRECERLQGWPDDHTRYGKRESGEVYEIADGPRYKMCGNGVTASVAKWIGSRLLEVSA